MILLSCKNISIDDFVNMEVSMKKYSVLVLLVLLICLLFTGCSFLNNNNDEISVNYGVYESYATGFNYLSKTELEPEEVPDDVRDIELELKDDYTVEYEQVTATSSYDNICTMGVNNDILYPGALVDMKNGAFSPIAIARTPVKISANLETVQGIDAPIYTTAEASLSGVRTGIREIVNNNITSTTNLPANLSYEVREINDEKEFLMNLGFGLQVSKFSLSENFSQENIKKQTNIAVVLKQIYFTVDMDSPKEKNGRDLFDAALSVSEINQALEGTIPAYVSSVAYGRIAVITIQSNYSKQEITNALSVGWGKMSDSPGSSSAKRLSIEFDNTLQNIATDSETEINCFVYGGSASQSLSIGADPSNTLTALFSEFNANGDGALPVSYTLRHLNGELAKIQSNNEYVIKHVTYNAKKIMDWSYLDKMIKDGSLFDSETLKLDFSSMIDFSDVSDEGIEVNRTITIPDNIKDLYIIGPNRGAQNIIFNGFSLILDYRNASQPLGIHLDSISFTGDSKYGGTCIYSDMNALVTVFISRTVILKGTNESPAINCKNLTITGDGRMTVYGGQGYNGNDGATAISAEELLIDSGEVIVVGGKGSNGNNGAPGGKGSAGENGLNQVSGKPGGQGSPGTNAENGANGGFAIKAKVITIAEEADVNLIGGQGGTGGIGGVGGTGGNGGIGYAGVIGSAGGGNGGKGGAGGNGGNGGNGSAPISCDKLIVNGGCLTLTNGNGGTGGQGGAGGAGGKGGNTTQWGAYCGWPGGGGAGGNGGNGGNGGMAGLFDLELILAEINETANVTLIDGEGGNGGYGGKGGAVGNVGSSALDRPAFDSGSPGKEGLNGLDG